MMRLTFLIAACLGLFAAAGTPRAADGLFSPRVVVNNSAITNFEVEQRILFLRALNSPGDLPDLALTGLIDDRLRFQAAEANGIVLTDEQITEGLAEFAGRANLTVEEFQAGLAETGIEPETFRDFVQASLTWREVVRALYVPRVVVSNGEVERALSVTNQRGDVRILLSELILPAPPGQEADALAQAEELRASITSQADFESAASQFSAAPSAPEGGRIDWLPLGNLPPSIRTLLLPLRPGEVSPPIPIPNAVALFQLRGLEDTGRPAEQAVTLDYMQILLSDGESALAEAARLRAGADRCDDLYGLAKGLPPEQMQRFTQGTGEVPRDVALELAKLDAGETSFALRRGNARVFLMLCTRNVAVEGEAPTPAQIRDQLINQRLAAYAEKYLNELRAAAIIREP